MHDAFKKIIESTGEDIQREGLLKTPKRAAESFEFLTDGYKQDIDEIINNAIFPTDNDEMVIVKNIELYSLCEHHLLSFFGQCQVPCRLHPRRQYYWSIKSSTNRGCLCTTITSPRKPNDTNRKHSP